MLYISITIEQEVWCVATAGEAVFDEALSSAVLFGLAGCDAVLGFKVLFCVWWLYLLYTTFYFLGSDRLPILVPLFPDF